ncbi:MULTISPECIES: alpha/beta hydrolase [Lactiplantibacillus]|uniref:Alpha/beta hydrolase n=1 Tax=Lactiplantibacillus pentosus TaxID=1589 RepID=A0AAW8W9H3_LACPE|nr:MULTISPECIES: alpha/beta hydrolase [Lactiplantibacillus]MBU7462160.1 alpha/beta hydrolase [Lactiplantibacillus pentosus]MBU7477541.1 alpha/beta hydrolase [Lactiplantibacillus pentosus]MBU7484576.1 alpha/beta hydrolase [Lactiplantibacillus sp. 30.2.29]MBU7487979.1 alpha/beta hydrolase [Lactiplantibacillus pentosus]MBU7501068.1 alpha/beta hydrolase [Lactiplantibacillus pentosus]
MQIEQQTLNAAQQPFQVTAYWLDQISDFETAVDYPLMIICPGGGFTYHSGREEAPIAARMVAAGMHAIVLNYQLIAGHQTVYPAALQQLAATIDWVTQQATQHHIDTQRIVLAGFSAGGHVVATFNGVATQPELRAQYQLDQYAGHHAAVILGYPVIDLQAGFPTTAAEREQITTDRQLWAAQQLVTATSKPAFVWQTVTDELVPPQNSLAYVQALLAHQIPTAYHLFSSGIHGLALANHVTQKPGKTKYLNAQAAQWPELALAWLQERDILAGTF